LDRFHLESNHTLVTKSEDVELFRWCASIRKNYNPPNRVYISGNATTSGQEESFSSSWTEAYASQLLSNNDKVKRIFRKRNLSSEKYRQLDKAGFVWDVQSALWDRRYVELVGYHNATGHCRVPMTYPNGLGVWVKNQRKEYRRLETGEHSNLTRQRLEKLHALSFAFSRPRKESWEDRYNELIEFHRIHGHSNVPENYPENPSLGIWCMNQRIAYRRQMQHANMPNMPGPFTQDRMRLLEDLNFTWNVRRENWQQNLNRLKSFYHTNGHVQIPSSDLQNKDLRTWLTFQRYCYHLRKRMEKREERLQKTDSVHGSEKIVFPPLTEERISAIEEAIPDFQWRIRGSGGGPSREDWADLFEAMREKGIRPGMRAKQHWFEGQNRFESKSKDVWTEKDLLELWNQEDDEEEDSDFDYAIKDLDGAEEFDYN